MKNKKKDGINNRDNYNNNESNIIGNILRVNKIKSNNSKNNKICQDNGSDIENKLLINDYNQPGDFTFIKIINQMKKYDPNEIKSVSYDNYKIIINIIVDDDSLNSSNNLAKILKLISSSLNSLNKIKITAEQILVIIFFQHLTYESSFNHFFPGLKFYNYINTDNYSNNNITNNIYSSFGYYTIEKNLNIFSFYKESLTFIELYNFFYTELLPNLINIELGESNKNILIVNWPNGKVFSSKKNSECNNYLKNIVKICNNENMILIPDINFIPNEKEKNFGQVNKYILNSDKININLIWYVDCGYPIDHRFFFVNMNKELFSILKKFYNGGDINYYSNEYFHDYYLAIYLKNNMKKIEIQYIEDVKVEYSDLPWNIKIFFTDLMLRRGSEYVNFFHLLKYFISCRNLDFKRIFEKIFIFFKLIYNCIQFFWLGITFLICYAVFNDTFGTKGNKMDYFCSLGYVIMTIILLSISLLYIKNNPKIKHNKIILNTKLNNEGYTLIAVLYLIHYIYFFFFVICAIIALIHIEQGEYSDIKKVNEYYIFSTDFFIILFFINLFLSILPSFFRFNNLISKGFIFNLFLYLPNQIAFFHYPYLFTCIKNINAKAKKKEAIYIVLYVVLNGIVTVICLVFDTTRQRRMDFLCIMSIIISSLNVVNLIVCVIGICKIKGFKKRYARIIGEKNEEEVNTVNTINSTNNNDINTNNEISTNNMFIKNNFGINNFDNNINNNTNDKEEISKGYNSVRNNELSNSNLKINPISLSQKLSLKKISIFSKEKNPNISDINNTSNNLYNYPMNTTENNLEINPFEEEIKNNEINISKKEHISQNYYPHDNTQSFSIINNSLTENEKNI